MATKLIKEEHGVRLEFCPADRAGKIARPHYRISSKRPVAAKVRFDEAAAHQVWRDEVGASKLDPMVARILAAGL